MGFEYSLDDASSSPGLPADQLEFPSLQVSPTAISTKFSLLSQFTDQEGGGVECPAPNASGAIGYLMNFMETYSHIASKKQAPALAKKLRMLTVLFERTVFLPFKSESITMESTRSVTAITSKTLQLRQDLGLDDFLGSDFKYLAHYLEIVQHVCKQTEVKSSCDEFGKTLQYLVSLTRAASTENVPILLSEFTDLLSTQKYMQNLVADITSFSYMYVNPSMKKLTYEWFENCYPIHATVVTSPNNERLIAPLQDQLAKYLGKSELQAFLLRVNRSMDKPQELVTLIFEQKLAMEVEKRAFVSSFIKN